MFAFTQRAEVGPASVYVAYSSPGKPVVAYGRGGEGLYVEMYFGKKGRLKGVVVSDDDTGKVLTVAGKVPVERED